MQQSIDLYSGKTSRSLSLSLSVSVVYLLDRRTSDDSASSSNLWYRVGSVVAIRSVISTLELAHGHN